MKIPSTQPLASRRIVLGSSIGVFAATVAAALVFWLAPCVVAPVHGQDVPIAVHAFEPNVPYRIVIDPRKSEYFIHGRKRRGDLHWGVRPAPEDRQERFAAPCVAAVVQAELLLHLKAHL